VKFVFATTEIRKVPVTVLSRCQRFDLRRIETAELVGLLKTISEKETVKIEDPALALIARAAEGSARDSLSLLDQAIAHGEEDTITAEMVRGMLGLADRGRILDLFEKLMGGKLAEALADLNELYDRGADPLAVMQDLLETTHFLTRVKVAPNAEGFFDGSSSEGRRAAEMAAKLPVAALTRAWQMLLKGLIEVRDATRPIAACEMALIRLSYAADLPPTDKLVRDLLDGAAAPAPRGAAPAPPSGTAPRALRTNEATANAQRLPQPIMDVQNAPALRTLEDIVALAVEHRASVLKVHLENDVHLVRLEPGIIEFRPSPRAPNTLAGDLKQKLKEWTGASWSVSIAREGGAPTIAEQKKSAKAARLESVMQEPLVRAVLDRFPGAEIVAVRDAAAADAPSEAVDD
jgi:DNA polymerase-3 subunit gamma/tau